MEKWNYKSLEWIHGVREENHRRTKDLSFSDIISKTFHRTEEMIKRLNLKVIKKGERVLA